MIGRLAVFWERISNSLWALPLLFVVGASIAGVLTLNLQIGAAGGDAVWWLYSGTASSASGFLSSLLTAMITMTTLAISITMVVLALAAQSLGPRLISAFIGDVRTRLNLGLLVGTVIYLLIILRTMGGRDDNVPQLAVTVGTVLVMACITALVFFVHHLARSIVADTIVGRVGATLDGQVSEVMSQEDDAADANWESPELPGEGGRPIGSPTYGYVRYVDYRAIVELAEAAGVTVRLTTRPGQFVIAHQTLGWIAPADAIDPDKFEEITDTIVLGSERSAVQDIEYSVRQLVEIALRALSPGVNDPFTACTVIDRLSASIAMLMGQRPPRTAWSDSAGVIRLHAPQSTFEGIVDAAFNQIRQAGAAQPAVLIQLTDRLGQLLRQCDDAKAGAVILKHLDLVAATGERAIPDQADRIALRSRITEAREIMRSRRTDPGAGGKRDG